MSTEALPEKKNFFFWITFPKAVISEHLALAGWLVGWLVGFNSLYSQHF